MAQGAPEQGGQAAMGQSPGTGGPRAAAPACSPSPHPPAHPWAVLGTTGAHRAPPPAQPFPRTHRRALFRGPGRTTERLLWLVSGDAIGSRGGWGGDAEAGLVGGGGSAGWTEVKLEHKGQLPALPSQWGNRGSRAPDRGAGAQRLAHAWTHLGRGGRWAQRPSAGGDPRASRGGPRPSYLVVGP